jgi:ABC-type antimicrobial peptide transport system permease subunit
MKTLAAQLDQTLLTERLIALLSAGLGLLATLLAAIGLYGVMAFVVTRRSRELGLRMALGLGRFVATQLYGIKANDPWIAGATLAVLIVVSGAAGLIPATRASRIDPIMALRYE